MKTFKEFILECELVEGKVAWDDPKAPTTIGLTPRERNRRVRIKLGIEDPERVPSERDYERYGKLLSAHQTQSNIKQPKKRESHYYTRKEGPNSYASEFGRWTRYGGTVLGARTKEEIKSLKEQKKKRKN